MTNLNQVIDFVCDLALKGQGADFDGHYGTQCVDLPNWVCGNFFGKALWGNAIDLMTSAEGHGFECHYMPTEANPRAGAVFVMAVPDHQFGHTGIAIKDSDGYTMKTVEQNIDGYSDTNGNGINDQLEWGGPARFNTRDFSGVVGWFYPPYDSKPVVSQPTSGDGVIHQESGSFTVQVQALNVRANPGLSGEIVATYGYGMTINYDGWLDKDGYIWISYIGGSGLRRYVSAGKSENGVNVAPFGTFS